MTVKAKDMARDVRVAMDMNREDKLLLGEEDTDTLGIEDMVLSVLEDAVRSVELRAPLWMLGHGHDFGEEVYMEEDGSGYVLLPEDFMRLVAFRMSDWKRTVYTAVGGDSGEYAVQSSRWRGVRGTPEKPVAAIVQRSEGKVLEFWSCRDRVAKAVQASYVPWPRMDRDGGIDVSRECYRPAVLKAAAMVMAMTGDARAQALEACSEALLR